MVYYCADNLAESSPGARKLRRSEDALFAEADLVLTTSTGLQAMAAAVAKRVEQMLSEVVDLVPDMSFMLAGPVSADIRRLASRPNVRLVGPLSHSEVIRHIVQFDVGILPYIVNRFTKDVMPMKLKQAR